MAKKTSKHQSKPANTANLSNTVTVPTSATPVTEDIAPVTTTAPPSASQSDPVSSSAPYKPITDNVSIERLVSLAKDSPPDSALGIVWNRAYEEAYQNGRKEVLQDLRKKLEDKFKEGRKEGVKEGKDLYYGKGIVRGECDEHQRWKAAGHGGHCLSPNYVRDDASTQMDPQDTVYISANPANFISSHVVTQTSIEAAKNNITTTSTVDMSVQTSPYIFIPSQTEATTSQNFETGHTTHLATSQSPVLSRNAKNLENSLYSENLMKSPVFFFVNAISQFT